MCEGKEEPSGQENPREGLTQYPSTDEGQTNDASDSEESTTIVVEYAENSARKSPAGVANHSSIPKDTRPDQVSPTVSPVIGLTTALAGMALGGQNPQTQAQETSPVTPASQPLEQRLQTQPMAAEPRPNMVPAPRLRRRPVNLPYPNLETEERQSALVLHQRNFDNELAGQPRTPLVLHWQTRMPIQCSRNAGLRNWPWLNQDDAARLFALWRKNKRRQTIQRPTSTVEGGVVRRAENRIDSGTNELGSWTQNDAR